MKIHVSIIGLSSSDLCQQFDISKSFDFDDTLPIISVPNESIKWDNDCLYYSIYGDHKSKNFSVTVSKHKNPPQVSLEAGSNPLLFMGAFHILTFDSMFTFVINEARMLRILIRYE